MELFKKKGQVGAVGAIVALVVGVGVSVIVIIFISALGGQTYNVIESDLESIGNTSIVNKSLSFITNKGGTIGNSNIHSGTFVLKNTTGFTVPANNYTLDLADGGFNLTDDAFNDTALLGTYNYGDLTIQNSVKSSIVSGFQAIEQTGNYLPLIVLAVVIALVLTIVLGFTSFGGGSNNSGGFAL